MPICLFCDNELDVKTRPEHVLLSALGGRKTSRRVVCSECNGQFGSTIDKELAESVSMLRAKLGHESGAGKPPPKSQYRSTHGMITVDNNGRSRFKQKPFAVQREGSELAVTLAGDDFDHLMKNLRHLAAYLKCEPEHLLSMLKEDNGKGIVETFAPVPSERGRLAVGGEACSRSISKSCLELLALQVGNEALHAPVFAAARAFVMHGNSTFNVDRVFLDTRPLPNEAEIRAQYGPAFHMVCVANDRAGAVRGYFRLYGYIAWSVLLAETSQLANVSVCLICNPVNGKWTEDIGQFGDANAEWLSDARFNQRQATEWLSSVLQHAYELQLERAVGRLVRDEFLRHGIEGDRTAGEEIKQKVIGEISARVSALVLRLPYERAVAWETVEKALALTRGNV